MFEEGYEWDIKAFKASMEHLSRITNNSNHRNKIWLLVRTNRNIARKKKSGRFSDAPDTPQEEGKIAKETAEDIPILLLLRQNGSEDNGWRGSPFWWPVLMAPRDTRTAIFAGSTSGSIN